MGLVLEADGRKRKGGKEKCVTAATAAEKGKGKKKFGRPHRHPRENNLREERGKKIHYNFPL